MVSVPGCLDVLSAALSYSKFGWSLIPLTASTKLPAVKWKPFQTARADEHQLCTWFDRREDLGLAVVLGPVSGGLTCRDFDDVAAYEVWKAANPELAKTLPTARTKRGFHVYFHSDLERTEKFADGELRGKGGYVVLPPSRHPDGGDYQWIIEPTPDIHRIDPGLFRSSPLPTERQSYMASVSPSLGVSGSPSLCSERGETTAKEIIKGCLPTRAGERNDKIFELAQTLKFHPTFQNANPSTLDSILREWHRLALPVIETKSFSETQADFEHAWESVKFPKGTDLVEVAWRNIPNGSCPPEAVRYDSEDMRKLAALCLELQRSMGPGRQFFLACRSAAKVLQRLHTEVAKWLKKLARDGILKCSPRPGYHKAHGYRYTGASWKETPG